MSARLCLCGVFAACYSARALPGSPCSPDINNCPEGQSCALVAGGYVCVEGVAGDAAMNDTVPDMPGWRLLQVGMSTMAAMTVLAPTSAGNMIVVGVETDDTNTVSAVTDNAPGASNVYTAIPGARSLSTAVGSGLELWYAPNSRAGATTVTVSAAALSATVVWEVAGIRATDPIDAVAIVDNQPATTTPKGAPITTTVAGDFTLSVAIVNNSVTRIHANNAFTNDSLADDDGWGHLSDPAAPAGTFQAQWDQDTSGPYCSSSVAFVIAR